MINELSKTNSNFFDLQMHKLSKNYIDQNFRRFDNGPVIIGNEVQYRIIIEGINDIENDFPIDYNEFMKYVQVVRGDSNHTGGLVVLDWGKYGAVGVHKEAIENLVKDPYNKRKLVCGLIHEKNHIKYPDYTEKQVAELDIDCLKKLGLK